MTSPISQNFKSGVARGRGLETIYCKSQLPKDNGKKNKNKKQALLKNRLFFFTSHLLSHASNESGASHHPNPNFGYNHFFWFYLKTRKKHQGLAYRFANTPAAEKSIWVLHTNPGELAKKWCNFSARSPQYIHTHALNYLFAPSLWHATFSNNQHFTYTMLPPRPWEVFFNS